VTDVNLVASAQGGEIRITGSGTFKIGGDPAPTEEMQLELRGAGAGPIFDSGLVLEGAPGFPTINWEVPQSPSPSKMGAFRVGGFGIYEASSLQGQQRMVLDLTLDGKPSQQFDSGLVSGNESIFRVDIELAANRFACFDQVFDLHALQRHRHGIGELNPHSPM